MRNLKSVIVWHISYQTGILNWIILIWKVNLKAYCNVYLLNNCILGSIGNESDIKRCLHEAPKLLLTLKTLLNSVSVNS